MDELWCELCGNDVEHGASLTMAWTNGNQKIRCTDCERRLEGGLLRVEYVEGVPRLRVWHFEWTPGDLLPSAEANRKRAGL